MVENVNKDGIDYSNIKGFNYQPSWGSTGLEIWRNFDSEKMAQELSLGKCYFPKMNAIRLWLSHDAWCRNPKEFESAFETALSIADKKALLVMPVLFNRWHDCVLDYGGIYIDHFLPKASWVQVVDYRSSFAEAIFTKHADDSRIFAWDLCNEPFFYETQSEEISDILNAEYAWLENTYKLSKKCKVQAPITVGIHCGDKLEGIRRIEPISDVLSIHPYWTYKSPEHEKGDFERLLDDYVDFANRVGKPLIATETCWGAIDDSRRVKIIGYTLGELKKRNIGWLAYLLHHSLVADAHRLEFGPLTTPGNLSFIEADGSLRPGHSIFNDYF